MLESGERVAGPRDHSPPVALQIVDLPAAEERVPTLRSGEEIDGIIPPDTHMRSTSLGDHGTLQPRLIMEKGAGIASTAS